MTFDQKLKELINNFSKEQESDTPDFLLRDFIVDVLGAANRLINARELWYDAPEDVAPQPAQVMPSTGAPYTVVVVPGLAERTHIEIHGTKIILVPQETP